MTVYDELTALQNPVPGTVEVQTLSWIRVDDYRGVGGVTDGKATTIDCSRATVDGCFDCTSGVLGESGIVSTGAAPSQ